MVAWNFKITLKNYKFHDNLINICPHTADSDQAEVYSDDQIAEIIDGAFAGMDKNNDGQVDFAEYRVGDETAGQV